MSAELVCVVDGRAVVYLECRSSEGTLLRASLIEITEDDLETDP